MRHQGDKKIQNGTDSIDIINENAATGMIILRLFEINIIITKPTNNLDCSDCDIF